MIICLQERSAGDATYAHVLFKHFVAYSTREICIHTKTQCKRYTTGD